MIDISLSHIDGRTLFDGDAVLERYEIFLFTSPTEFSPFLTFGAGLDDLISEPNTEQVSSAIRQRILAETERLFPQIVINSISLTRPQLGQLNISLDVTVVPYNQRKIINRSFSG